MITRASKAFFGLAASAWALAIAYALITTGLNGDGPGVVSALSGDGAVDALIGGLTFGYKGSVGDHVGYAVLMGFALSCVVAGAISSVFRDGDPEAVAELLQVDAVPPVAAPADLSPWPLVAAVGAALATIGLATGPLYFVAGAAVVGIAAIEWTVKSWSEHATGDPEVNRTIRNRLMHPVELPVGALVIVLVLGVCASRILLYASKTGALIILASGAVLILGAATALAALPKLRRGVAVGAIVVAAVVFLALGVWGAVKGPREFEHHEGGTSTEGAAALVVSPGAGS